MIPYVPITRHFREWTEDPEDSAARWLPPGLPGLKSMTWQSLLRPDAKERATSAVIVVAPSGAGKSTEVAQQTERLRHDGHAVFC